MFELNKSWLVCKVNSAFEHEAGLKPAGKRLAEGVFAAEDDAGAHRTAFAGNGGFPVEVDDAGALLGRWSDQRPVSLAHTARTWNR